jgi:hypothetical protein
MSKRRDLPLWRRQREAYEEQMAPAAVQVAKEFDEACRRNNRSTAMIWHAMGEQVRDMLAQPNDYGPQAIEQLATFIGWEGRIERLYLLARMASVFSKEFIAEQINAPTNAGNGLRFGHFLELASVESEKVRLGLLEQARDKLLSVEQLRELILEMRS